VIKDNVLDQAHSPSYLRDPNQASPRLSAIAP